MSKKKLPSIYRRKWLNKKEGTAYINVQADVEGGYGKDDKDTILSAYVEFKDCTRQCSLEFYAYDQQEFKERMAKLDLIINELNILREFMVANPPSRVSRKRAKGIEIHPDITATAKETEEETKDEPQQPTVHEGSAVLKPVRQSTKT